MKWVTVEMATIVGTEMQQRFHNNLRSVTAETQVLYLYLTLCGQLVSDHQHASARSIPACRHSSFGDGRPASLP